MSASVYHLPIRWVRLPLYCEVTGEPIKTVRNRISSGAWLEGIHWKCIDRRRWINLIEAQEWIEKGGIRAWK